MKKPNLYEVLGLNPRADSADIEFARKNLLDALEINASGLDSASLSHRKMMIRVAANTLLDPSSRLTYDQSLAREASDMSSMPSANNPYALNSMGMSTALSSTMAPTRSDIHDSVNLRAESLSLRAEALALRADAMLLQAGVPLNSSASANTASGLARFFASGAMWRTVIFFGLLATVGLMLSRCAFNVPTQGSAAQNRAAEKAALQEYFQTYGVRPANMAELELLQAERRRRDNEQKSEKQDKEQEARKQKQFEEESKRISDAASRQLREDEWRHQEQMLREQREAEQEARQRKESERMAEEERVRKLQEQWKQVIQR
jgi:flagellar biosynthesis GTPase FlhF